MFLILFFCSLSLEAQEEINLSERLQDEMMHLESLVKTPLPTYSRAVLQESVTPDLNEPSDEVSLSSAAPLRNSPSPVKLKRRRD
ncbi:MAG: hypothetical protein KBD63_05245 [Bacteriovoracaceae bacterium]|nr:hypothetical protein [Bacteriovoracaceae bacterium]